MVINVPDGYTWNYLDINCATTDSCSDTYITCIGGSYRNDVSIPNGVCDNTGAEYCCPYYDTDDELGVCISGQDCVVDCTTQTCSFLIIDASKSSSLTVTCGYDDCRYTRFYCPPSGCDISCSTSYACRLSNLYYDGRLSDYGKVTLYCYDYWACRYTRIEANYVYELEWICNSPSNDYTCQSILNANFANKVTITATGNRYASYYDVWNVKYAKDVIINGDGYIVIAYSDLIADYAESVTINLAADTPSLYPLSNVDWYIPENTVINCFGYGCYYLNNLYRGGAVTSDGLQINIDTCEVSCETVGDCIYDFDLICDAGTDSYTSSNLCSSSSYNQCGCKDLIENVTVFTDYTEQQCYTPRTVQECEEGVECVIDCNSITGSCANEVIDGRLATDLIVNCVYDHYCDSTVIYCPLSGCVINCNADDVCDEAIVVYNGGLLDVGKIEIVCNGTNACSELEIDADYVDDLAVNCSGRSTFNDYPCSAMVVNANYANKVAIDAYGRYASSDNTFNFIHAGSIIINANGYCMCFPSLFFVFFLFFSAKK